MWRNVRKISLLSTDSNPALPILTQRIPSLINLRALEVNRPLPHDFAAGILPQLTDATLSGQEVGSLLVSPPLLDKLELIHPRANGWGAGIAPSASGSFPALDFFKNNSFPRLKRLSLVGVPRNFGASKLFSECAPAELAAKFPVLESISVTCHDPTRDLGSFTAPFGPVSTPQLVRSCSFLLSETLSNLRKLTAAVETLRHVDLHFEGSIRNELTRDPDFTLAIPNMLGVPFNRISVDGTDKLWDLLPLPREHKSAEEFDKTFSACFETAIERLEALARSATKSAEFCFRARKRFDLEMDAFIASKMESSPSLSLQMLTTLACVSAQVVTQLAGFGSPPGSVCPPWNPFHVIAMTVISLGTVALPIVLSLATESQREQINASLLSQASPEWLLRQGVVDFYLGAGLERLLNVSGPVWEVLVSEGALDHPLLKNQTSFLSDCFFFTLLDCKEAADKILDVLSRPRERVFEWTASGGRRR